MAHGNTVANRYGIEFKSAAARPANSTFDDLCNFVEVDVTRNYLAEAIGNTDERFVNIGVT
jgi:hypothetical protein